jgi:hypothetical protein
VASLTVIEYREPGNSGYNISSIVEKGNYLANAPSTSYSKYLYSCIDRMNGTSQQCLLETKDMFIQCINDCELIPCSGQVPTIMSNSLHIAQDEDKEDANTKDEQILFLCQNYGVMEVDDSTTGLLGYIPRTSSCINKYVQPEERVGYVLKNYTSHTNGNCYYEDKVTLVQRTESTDSSTMLFSNYAACPQIDSSNNFNNMCNSIFRGGFSSFNYDPRYRPWYIATKKVQTEVWTAPYVYAGENAIGITYSIPMYNLENDYEDMYTNRTSTIFNKTTAKTKIFNGVIAVDYYLESISQYLVEQFADTSMQILVIEPEEPNYLIASSIRDNSISKLVLIDDKNKQQQPCPADKVKDTTLCEPVRLTVKDLGSTDNIDSIVLYRAFQAYSQSAFNISSSSSASNNNHTEQQQYYHVNFKSDDMIGSQAFTARGQTYTQSNLNWIVLVIVPMNRSPTDASLVGTTSFYVVCILGTVGFIGCLSLLLKFYSKRKERAVIYSDWVFTCAFILGCTTLNLSSLTLVGENTNPLCMLRMWSFNALLVCGKSLLSNKWFMALGLYCKTNTQNYRLFLTSILLFTSTIIGGM